MPTEQVHATLLPARADDHVVGAADLVPGVLEDLVLDTARAVHAAIAARVFGLVPAAGKVRPLHDGIAHAVYEAVGVALRAGGSVVAGVARATRPSREHDVLADNRRWQRAVAIVNGLIGDELTETGSPLALTMTVRRGGHDVELTAEGLATAFPDASGRVAVLVHGLMEDDHAWSHALADHGTTYMGVLRRSGVSPVVLRYNSGHHISDNGRALSALLDRLVEEWPVPITELLLIGHSMGGLVIRAAGDCAPREARWRELVHDVVLLGSPHTGATLAQLVHSGSWLLDQLPELAPFAAILRRRSVGVRDLFHGYLRQQDWEEHDSDSWVAPPAGDVPAMEGVRHHLVGATLTSRPTHPVGHVLGDVLVRWGSATAAGREWAREASITHVGPADHFALLNHPQVADLLSSISAEQPAAVGGSPGRWRLALGGSARGYQPGRSRRRSRRTRRR